MWWVVLKPVMSLLGPFAKSGLGSVVKLGAFVALGVAAGYAVGIPVVDVAVNVGTDLLDAGVSWLVDEVVDRTAGSWF